MSFDPHGQLHAGSIGLFDDPDEYDRTQRHFEKIKLEREKRAREADERGRIKAAKRNRKRLEQEHRNNRGSGRSWLGRLFGRDQPIALPEGDMRQPNRAIAEVHPRAQRATVDRVDAVEKRGEREGERRAGRAPSPAESTYSASQVEELDSPFYEELGLVVLKADNFHERRVVPKRKIRPRREKVVDEAFGQEVEFEMCPPKPKERKEVEKLIDVD